MILAIGEILFDIFPQGRRLGGAPFNFAFHVHRLDGPVRFLSRIGNDPEGRAIRDFLDDQQFPTDDLQQDPDKPTGRVAVTLDNDGSPRFDILPATAYDAVTATPAVERFAAEDCRLIYFGSLIQRTPQGAGTLRRILDCRAPRTKCLFDVNLRPGCYTDEILRTSLADADVLKLNEVELDVIADMMAIDGPVEDKVAALRDRFDIETLALTRGERGSSLFAEGSRQDVEPPLDVTVRDTVGAGDAFSAMLAIGTLRAWPAERLLTTANRLAAMVCGIDGAVPEDPAFYEPMRDLLAGEGGHG